MISCTLKEKYIRFISSKEKTKEARMGNPMFQKWQVGDEIKFFSKRNPKMYVIIKITRKAHYKNVQEMLEKEGYPFKSKEHSLKVGEWQKGSLAKANLNYRVMSGKSRYACPKKLLYQYEIDFKIKLSDKCCYRLKKDVIHKWEKANNRTIAMTGMLKEDGGQRENLVNCLTTKNNKVVKFHPILVCSTEWEDWFIQKYEIDAVKYEIEFTVPGIGGSNKFTVYTNSREISGLTNKQYNYTAKIRAYKYVNGRLVAGQYSNIVEFRAK